MVSKFTKKLSLVILLLLAYVVYCYSQESSSEQHTTTDLNTIDLWSGVEWNLNLLEQDQNNMKIFIDQQGLQIEGLENAYLDQQQLYLDLENSYAKLEQDTKKWKTCSIVLGTTTVTLGISTLFFWKEIRIYLSYFTKLY